MSEGADDRDIDAASGALGWGLATFAVTIEMLNALTRKGVLTTQEAHEVIRRANLMVSQSGGFPGDSDAAAVAQHCMKLVEQLFHAATAEPPDHGRN